MTTTIDEDLVATDLQLDDSSAETDQPDGGEASAPRSDVRLASPGLTVLASCLGSAAAAFMLAGAFRGMFAYLVSFLGVVIGGFFSAVSFRFRRPALAQWLALPVALAVGAAFMAPDAKTGTASIGNLVIDAVHRGGLQQPPVPMDPGWRLILVALFAAMAVGTSALAVALNRPKLTLMFAAPVTMLTSLIQPPGRELISTLGALVLLLAALAVSYSAELSGVASLTAGFELRRLARSAVLAVVMAGLVGLLAQAGVLFPTSQTTHIIPPRKPSPPPPQKDRQLFHIQGDLKGRPLRVGVLDEYNQSTGDWLFPPYDTSRFVRLKMPANLAPVAGKQAKVRIMLDDIGGHDLPTIANASKVDGAETTLTFDPRTSALQTADKPAFAGLSYELTAPVSPTGKTLSSAKPAPVELGQFLSAPTPPAEVLALLQKAGTDLSKAGVRDNGFDRMQALRTALYRKVVAAGAGKPAPVTVTDVVSMLKGGEASPFQINEAEALLARWAGVPSRIGFGYYGGEAQSNATLSFRPKDGAAWLEVYFEGSGWVPIVGVPLQAKSDTSTDNKNTNPSVIPSENLAIIVYTPVKDTGLRLLFQYVQYYAARAFLVGLGMLFLWLLYPVGIKRLRHRRRAKWAAAAGPQAQILAAYVEFRDVMRDLAIGDPSATPMEFLAYVQEDAEHAELAWLVTRSLWGDLGRDVRRADAHAAADLSSSVASRIARALPYPLRVSGAVSRASLRIPYTDEVPNLWWRLKLPSPRPLLRAVRRSVRGSVLQFGRLRRLIPRRAS